MPTPTPCHPVSWQDEACVMHDPDEGVRPDGTIVSGARRDRVPVAFEPVIVAALDDVRATDNDIALYFDLVSELMLDEASKVDQDHAEGE
jgi:hypothetical protein